MHEDPDIIADFRPGDEEEINALYNEVFGGRRSLEEWRWKFRDHPFPDLAMISKLVRRGRIIGHVGSLPSRFKVGEKTVLGGQIVDYLIHPSFQLGKRSNFINQELNTRMKDAFVNSGIAFGYGFPNALSYPVAMKYLKHAEDLTQVPIWKKPLRPPPLRRGSPDEGRFASLRRLGARSMWHLRRMTSRRGFPGEEGFVLAPLSGPDPGLDAFWQEASGQLRIARVRDGKHLAWRFFNKPGGAYRFWLLRRNAMTMGYAVTKVKPGTVRTGYLIDFLVRPEEGILEILLRLVSRRMADDEIDVLQCLAVAGSAAARTLERMGFRREPEGVRMIAWLLTPSIDRSDFFDERNWHVTYADLDGT